MIRRGLSLALLILWPATARAAHKAFPPPPSTYVYNEAVISPSAEQLLSGMLSTFQQTTGHQFVVALFQNLDGESLEDYTNQVFRAWKVGSAKGNDGLLFALYKTDRKWRVEVGYGLEGIITDLQAGVIARDQGVPHFQSGDFDGGVLAICSALIAKLQGQDVAPPPRPADYSHAITTIIFLFIMVMILIQNLMVWTQGPRARNSGAFFIDFTSGGSFGGGGGFSGGGGGGGFSGGGGSSGGGGASGGW